MKKLEAIMDMMVKLLFLDKSTYKEAGPANCVNPETRMRFVKDSTNF
jgi:hypothetical protein